MAYPFFFHKLPLNDHSCSSVSSSPFRGDVHHHSLSQERLRSFKRPAESSPSETNRPLKQLKTNSFHFDKSSFTNPAGSVIKPIKHDAHIKNKLVATICQGTDHILAERRRREKLSQRFIALSALIPGMKKTNKASVLGDAIEYMKKLREKVKILEEQTNKKAMESVVFSSSDEGIGPVTTETLPWVEARFCNKDILVHIHCQKTKGVLEQIVLDIEKLHLSVVNHSLVSFGDSALDITIIAQKDEGFKLNMKEFVTRLRRGLILLFL